MTKGVTTSSGIDIDVFLAVDDLVAYFESLQQAFHKAKPRLKTVDISHWPTDTGLQYIHIGQMCLTLKEVRETPNAFYNYRINGREHSYD